MLDNSTCPVTFSPGVLPDVVPNGAWLVARGKKIWAGSSHRSRDQWDSFVAALGKAKIDGQTTLDVPTTSSTLVTSIPYLTFSTSKRPMPPRP